MLASALRGHIDDTAFQDLEERLLHALTRDVTRDGRVVALACDLVDLVDEDDAFLGLGHIVVRILQQPCEDALNVLTHIARLGQDRGIDDGERHVEHLGDGPGEQCLAGTGRSDHQDVGLLDQVVLEVDALVVIVHGDRKETFGFILPDHILVEECLDLGRLVEFALPHDLAVGPDMVFTRIEGLLGVFVRHSGTVGTDGDIPRRNQQVHLVLSTTAEGAVICAFSVFIGLLCHFCSFLRCGPPSRIS